MANLKDAFIVRPLPESDEFIITIGNHLATEEKFKSRKAAEMRINKTRVPRLCIRVFRIRKKAA